MIEPEPETWDAVADRLLDAIAYLRTHGKVNGQLYARDGSCCALGAYGVVAGLDTTRLLDEGDPSLVAGYIDPLERDVLEQAIEDNPGACSDLLHTHRWHEPIEALVGYSDQHTLDEVIDYLRILARWCRGQRPTVGDR